MKKPVSPVENCFASFARYFSQNSIVVYALYINQQCIPKNIVNTPLIAIAKNHENIIIISITTIGPFITWKNLNLINITYDIIPATPYTNNKTKYL